MSASSGNTRPRFGVIGCLNWSAVASKQIPASLTLATELASTVITQKAKLVTASWDAETAVIIDSSRDRSSVFSTELVGTSDIDTPVATSFFVNNIHIVTGGGGSGGGGSLQIFDEGNLVATVTELDFIGDAVQAQLNGADRADVTVTANDGTVLLPDDTDETDSTYFYWGYDEGAPNWQVRRQLRATGVLDVATNTNNALAYADAWTNRVTLVYA